MTWNQSLFVKFSNTDSQWNTNILIIPPFLAGEPWFLDTSLAPNSNCLVDVFKKESEIIKEFKMD